MSDTDHSVCEHEFKPMGVPGSELTENVCVRCGAVAERYRWKKVFDTEDGSWS